MESWVIRRLKLLWSEARSTIRPWGKCPERDPWPEEGPKPRKAKTLLPEAVLGLSQGLLEFHYPVHTVQMGI